MIIINRYNAMYEAGMMLGIIAGHQDLIINSYLIVTHATF